MNQGSLNTYAQKARRDFIAAVSDRAAFYGLTASGSEPIVRQGDVVLIGERPFPQEVAVKRGRLESRIRVEGFGQTMEAMAYTWFNRIAAIRYMELHGYLDHGYRVLSHPEDREQPEILDHAAEVDLPDLDREKVVELKLDGTRDEELYRLLLTAQCNALHQAMPFLFERIGDETELLLPVNLLHTDSLIRRLVEGIDESAWDEIEIIGWLYQFYISEKKDQVIGKVVKSEDIPAATQLFTPNWIVKYMVQNSVGAQWLATYPHSNLLGQMDYYIKPAEQTKEITAQLASITPSTLDPEALTLIDPACGSGHILVEAYDLFKAIYVERGYRQRDVPKLILEKNLFGLDIDARAAQLAGFAVMMRGRADDRRLFERGVKLNVIAFVNSVGLDAERLAQGMKLADYALQLGDLTELKRLFEHSTIYGSLIQVPESLISKLSALKRLSEATSQDLFVSNTLSHLGCLVRQAELLVARYDAVAANPPYMGGRGMNALVKKFAKNHFPDAKSDLFACFVERGYTLAKEAGYNAMVTMQSWMFLSSFEKMRERMLREKTIKTMAHLGARAFGSISGEVVQTTVFVLNNSLVASYSPVFFRLLDGDEEVKRTELANGEKRFDTTAQDEFKKIPGSPVAYWVSDQVRTIFEKGSRLDNHIATAVGLFTCDNDRFLRNWQEVSNQQIGFGLEDRIQAQESGFRFFPIQKGGGFRKWYGLNFLLVQFDRDGFDIRNHRQASGQSYSLPGEGYYFQKGITWSGLTSSLNSFRCVDEGHVFESNKGQMLFSESDEIILGFLNSCVARVFVQLINPTLSIQSSEIRKLPWIEPECRARSRGNVSQLVLIAKTDDRYFENSWDFDSIPILSTSSERLPTIESSYTAWIAQNRKSTTEMKRLEEENNRIFIEAYGLAEELTPDIPVEQITLTVNPAYRYSGNLSKEEQWTRFRRDTMAELVSYAIGCMMGRYSLDAPGLIYAHSGNVGFDATRYTTFPADSDGLVPLTDSEWFDDDAANRLVEFVSIAWDVDYLENNLTFLADNLAPRRSESSRDTIRRYLCDNFFKDHLQTYKNRPIYWLFSSGKYKAFQCLVYLHRYNGGTLARMRTEYAVPLQGMIASRVRQLHGDIAAATSTAHRRKLEKERGTLVKQQTELREFDERLRHYADRRIGLDLDDGVKVNYGKFGELLAAVTKVTGKNGRLMDSKQITDALIQAFKEDAPRIVFWNDPDGELIETLPSISLEGVSVLRLDRIGALEAKIRIEQDDTEGRYILYSPTEEPDFEDDWLLDMRLYSRSFRADRASIILQALGLSHQRLRQHLSTRRKFFDNKERLHKLASLTVPEDLELDLDRKMLAVVAKADQPELHNIVRTVFHAMLDGDTLNLGTLPPVWKQIEKFELDGPFWDMVQVEFGYGEDSPNLLNLLLRLFVSDFGHYLRKELSASLQNLQLPERGKNNAVVCLDQWRDSNSKARSFNLLSDEVAKILNLEDHLSDCEVEDLLDVPTFLDVEKRIVQGLLERVTSVGEAIDPDAIGRVVARRQADHWISSGSEWEDQRKARFAVYEALAVAATFLHRRHEYVAGFDFADISKMYKSYEDGLFRFDQLYRHFCENADLAAAQGWDMLKPLREEIEASYCNGYLANLALAWGQFVESELPDRWSIDGVQNQFAFFDRQVQPWLEEGDKRRAFVIISDAMRYEVAEELTTHLNGTYRIQAQLSSQLGVLPSYTSLGMASLLPHRVLEYTDRGAVLCDGRPTASLEQRNEILSTVGGMAIKADQLLALKKEAGRERVAGKRLVYIYHDEIDARGDKASTEGDTFDAARKTIQEISHLVRYVVNNLNGNYVVITADHGFLFTETAPNEPEKSKLDHKPNGTVIAKKRYLLGYDLPAHDHAWRGETAVTAKAAGGMVFWIPKGINRFHFAGGARFVHGGAMPQEIVVPVIKVKHVKDKGARDRTQIKQVTIHVLGNKHKITAATHRFNLVQMESVGERAKAVTLKVAVYDGDQPVTSIETVTFDSTSVNLDGRQKSVILTLRDRQCDKRTPYRLLLRDANTGVEQGSLDVVIDRAITDDF